jgi:protocatechuate 3,4-dioxygenase alpha subunit
VTDTQHPTPGQTVGPFFGYALPFDGDSELVPTSHPGATRLHGTVYDGAGAPVPDALLEIWQPDTDGNVVQQPGSVHRDGHTFTGWGRAATDNAGHYSFTTVEPGNGFFAMTVFARGLLDRLFTRVYLDAADPFLATLPEDRRSTLLVAREDGGLRFDVHLHGEAETVFLTYPGQSS